VKPDKPGWWWCEINCWWDWTPTGRSRVVVEIEQRKGFKGMPTLVVWVPHMDYTDPIAQFEDDFSVFWLGEAIPPTAPAATDAKR
jgi:hypothetical protein